MNSLRVKIFLFLTLLSLWSTAQNFELDTREIKDLVKKWNYANNWRSEETFQSIYNEEMIFYTEKISRTRCISLKEKLFLEHPEFKQKIISDPVFTPYTSGIIKSDFQKEVFQNGVWRKYQAYLLISYEDNQYIISGESDLQTDKTLKYTLEIGEPMDIPLSEQTAFENDSTSYSDSVADIQSGSEESTPLNDVYEEVLSEEQVLIPKKYLYFLIGFLALTALVVIFSRHGRTRNNRLQNTNTLTEGHKESLMLKGDKGFEGFVVSLFDPHFFTLNIQSRQKVLAGNGREHDEIPQLEFEFRNKDTMAKFVVECIYIPSISSLKTLNIFGTDMKRFDIQKGQSMDVYIIIGLAGESDNPKEIYLIKTSDVTEARITYSDLQPFRKFGMFYYNSAAERLQ
ncbi:MAG: hypothetical protein ABIR06_09585 [Cyclobacteriaceae bacterium]